MNCKCKISEREVRELEKVLGKEIMEKMEVDRFSPNQFISINRCNELDGVYLNIIIDEAFSAEIISAFIPKIMELISLRGNTVKFISSAVSMAKEIKPKYETVLRKVNVNNAPVRAKFVFNKRH